MRDVTELPDGPSLLASAIRQMGRIEGSLIKVDDFLNHRVDATLVGAIGRAIAHRYTAAKPDLVLTAEASGIAPALSVATHLSLPLVYAKKYGGGDAHRPAYGRMVTSPTKSLDYHVEVAHRVLRSGWRVLVVDDFLSRGRTALALGEIVEEAGAEVAGFGFAIEKAFMDGRQMLEERGWRVESLVRITGLDNGIDLEY